ncbi:MAG: 16S rRNA (cytosine(1402)-N(4))-methyltransferase RsmH [Pirellulales bacterium]
MSFSDEPNAARAVPDTQATDPTPNDHTVHIPVLLQEVLEWLAPQPGSILVDGTLGGGGHTRELAQRVAPGGLVIGLDRDPRAIERTAVALQGLPVRLVHASYADLPQVLAELGIPAVDGVLLDLGLSSDQLADDERGFSFHSDGPLDLRFDTESGRPAWELLQRMPTDELANLIYEYGEERHSRRIAREIVAARQRQPIRTAAQLGDLLRRVVPRSRQDRIDPATRTFQALRIAVNGELKELERALLELPSCLRPGGRAAIISFHSLEDRLVKQSFRDNPRWNSLTKKPIWPSEEEEERNPRSRSARLRVAESVSSTADGRDPRR